MNPRTEAARALVDMHTQYTASQAVWEARDHIARVCTRAVQRWDWPAATTYAAAYDLLTDLWHRAEQLAAARHRLAVARALALGRAS